MSRETPLLIFDDPLIGRKLGSCLIESRIGKGGMATVYRAIRDEDESVVAVKVMRQHDIHDKPEFLQRFQREARLMLALKHVNILPVYEFDTVGDITYLVMQLVDGGDLHDLIGHGTIPTNRSLQIIEEICGALDYAHEHGIVHRDLKPANVLLDQQGKTYLTDFGIAKWKEETVGLTVTGMVVGTPGYMAPEQWRTEPVDGRTDIYALGAMFFELLTGKMPFEAATAFSLMYKHLDLAPPAASSMNPAIPPSVDQVLARAMAKLPEQRYPSASALAASLKDALFDADRADTALEHLGDDDPVETLLISQDTLADTALTTAMGIDRRTYDAIDVGARTLLSRAREVKRETAGSTNILATALIEYVEQLRAQAKHEPDLAEGPYKALESYDIEDNRLFFGREDAIDAMLERAPYSKFTVLHAESGAGKTSLIRAGLMPRLLAGGFLPLYVAVRRRPPHEAIKHILLPQPDVAPDLQNASLHTLLTAISQAVGRNRAIFIFIDQFETFFTDVFSEEQRAEFVREVAECLDDATLQIRITLAMRTEYFGQVASFQPAIPHPFEKEFLLRRLQREQAERALVLPAQTQDYDYEDGLVEAILDDLVDDNGEVAPPQLQLVGTALIEALPEDRKLIERPDYLDAGGAKGVLASYLQRLLERLPAKDRRPARVLIESLVRADQTRDVRTPDSLRAEFEVLEIPTDNLGSLLQTLRENHVLRLVDTDAGHAYELVHDYLAQQVEIDPETATRKAAQELLDRRTRDYQQYGSLLTREEFDVIEAQRGRLRLTSTSRELINTSRRAFQRQRRIAISLGVASILGIVGILAIGLLAAIRESQNRQERLEDSQTAEARIASERDVGLITDSRRLADLAGQQLTIDPVSSLNLALEALTPRDRPYVPEAEFALSQAVQAVHERTYMPSDASVNGAEWNADFSQIMTWSSDGTIRLFDTVTGEEQQQLADVGVALITAAWSPNFTRIVAGDSPGGIYILDPSDTDNLRHIEGAHDSSVRAVAWAPDSERFLAWGDDMTTTLWDTEGNQIASLNGNQALWSPAGDQVLTIQPDNTLAVWLASTGDLVTMLSGHINRLNGASWCLDGSCVLSWSDDFRAILWDATTGEARTVFENGHTDVVTDAALSPDEALVVTAGFDGQIILWDARTSDQQWVASTEGAVVDGVIWNQDGSRILSYGQPDALAIWDAETGERLTPRFPGIGDQENFIDARWSPDEAHILTRSTSGLARVWRAATGQPIMALQGHDSSLGSAQWHPDGSIVLTSSGDGSARTWQVFDAGRPASNSEVMRFTAPAGHVLVAAWNADETLMATGHEDGSARIWDAQTGVLLHTLEGHLNQVRRLAWSPDQTQLASGGDGGLAIIWDVETGTLRHVLPHETAIDGEPATWQVMWIEWNQDGTRLLTSSDDGKVRVWNAASGELLLTLRQSEEPGDGAGRATWSREEDKILAVSDAGLVRIWDASSGDALLEIQVSQAPVLGARWNKDETQVLVWGTSNGFDGLAHLYDANSGELQITLAGHNHWVVSAAWNADESAILTTSRDGQAIIWDAVSGEQIIVLEGHGDNVTEGMWNPSGSRVLTRSVDGTARVWDVASGVEVQRVDGHQGLRVNSVTWNAQETAILSASHDGTARIWRSWPQLDDLIDYGLELVTRPLTPEEREAFFLATE
ncbi:MAG: protein kinase [Chloroflexi bacterium]|nr:protein kinase [Chloroflexota bacterium]